MSAQTRYMFGIEDDKLIHIEERIGRNIRDNKDEDNLFELLKNFNVFSSSEGEKDLKNMATKDLSTESMKESLLNANNLGQEQLERFVEKRLIKGADNDCPKMLLMK